MVSINSTRSRLLLVLLSVALLSAGWLGLSGLTELVALVPLLIISEGYGSSARDWWRMLGWAALTFLLWSAATIWWVWIATPLGPIAAGVVGTFYNLCAVMTYHYVAKRAPRALAYTLLVTVWIATEWAYNSADVMSFPWLLLGQGLARDVWAVQWYEYTGVFGGTLWVLVTNVAIFEMWRVGGKSARLRAVLIATLPMLFSAVLYLRYEPSAEEAQVAVVQPNVPCYEEERAESNIGSTRENLRELLAEVEEGCLFVLMPESALAYLPEVSSMDEAAVDMYQPLLRYMSGEGDDAAKYIYGASTSRFYGAEPATTTARYNDFYGWYDRFNSALLVNCRGEVESIYHKGRLVIGVEAIPFKGLFDLFEVDLGGISGQLGWGERYVLFENCGVEIGPAICYEGLYGEYYAGFVKAGATVMGVISNDGWWGDTLGHRRLYDFCRLRAIETRRAIARSANTGISGFISPRGDSLVEPLEWNERGVLTADVELRREKTIYVEYGDWVARVSTYIAVLSLFYYVAYRVRRRNHLVD